MKQAVRERRIVSDDGLTLVEMVVALFLVSLVLISFTSLSIASASSSRAADFRNRANQVGNQEVERLKALSWSDLGLYDNDTSLTGSSVTATCGSSESFVSLGTNAPSPRLAPALQRTVTANGRSFTVTSCVTWRDDPSDGTYALGTETDSGQGKDIKHLQITVSWNLLSKNRSLTFDSLRTPTALEVPAVQHATATLSLTSPSVSPSTQQLGADYSLSQPMSLSVRASVPATGVTVSYAGRTGNATATLATTDSGTNWTVVIPAGATGGSFNPGATTFTFYAQSTLGNAQTTATATFTAPPTAFTVTTSAAPTSVGLTSSGYLASPVTLTAVTSANATGVTVSIPVASGSITRTLTSSDQRNWTYTLAADSSNGPYNATANELFTFTATAASGSVTGTASIVLSAYSAPAVTITSVSVEEYSNRICAKGSGQMDSHSNQTLVITVQNASVNDTATAVYNSTTWGTSVGSPTSSGGVVTFKLRIPAGTAFPSSTAAVIVTVKRTSTDNVSGVTPQQNLTVFRANNSGQCT